VAVTWRAGAKVFEVLDGTERYLKDVEPETLGRLLKGRRATAIVLQRGMLPLEGERFVSALGRDAFDFSGYADDLERMLALLSLLDEYVTVSNTNVHLMAGLPDAMARVLVPFPPEWRWLGDSAESPWFPRFTVYRQSPTGEWSPATARLERDLEVRFGDRPDAGPAAPALVPVAPALRYSREAPSPRYRELMELYRHMHAVGDERYGVVAADMFPGSSFAPQARRIRAIIERTGARTLLDYGCGKGKQYEARDLDLPGVGRVPSVREYLGVDEVRCYDPAYAPHSALPDRRYDGVICTDVLEHCPEEDLEWIIAELFSHARRFVFANVASYPARKVLPTGENAHITQRQPKFWHEMFERVGVLHAGIEWEVYVTVRNPLWGWADRRLAGRGAAPPLAG
jgi:hypothetical protein